MPRPKTPPKDTEKMPSVYHNSQFEVWCAALQRPIAPGETVEITMAQYEAIARTRAIFKLDPEPEPTDV